MKPLDINVICSLRIPFEYEILPLLFNDPWYQAHTNEINAHYQLEFPSYYQLLQEETREITGDEKTIQLLENLTSKLQLNRKIHAFESEDYDNPKKIESRHFQDKSIFIISKPLNEALLERDLIPLLAREFGHLLYQPYYRVPTQYLHKKLIGLTDPEEQNNILRLLYLTNILDAIHEYNCDRLAICLTNFESLISAILQLDRINNKKMKPINIEQIINTIPDQISETEHILLKDYQKLDYRIFNMFLFSQRHDLIESLSLQPLRTPITLTKLIDYVAITQTYQKFQDTNTSGPIHTQLKNELSAEYT